MMIHFTLTDSGVVDIHELVFSIKPLVSVDVVDDVHVAVFSSSPRKGKVVWEHLIGVGVG